MGLEPECENQSSFIFNKIISEDPDQAVAVAAILTLLIIVQNTKSKTVMGLNEEIDKASKTLQKTNPQSISLSSGCRLFSVFLSRLAVSSTDFESYKKSIIERAGVFAKMSLLARDKISDASQPFVTDRVTIFTHGHSRAVCQVLKSAAESGRVFKVVLCSGRPMENCTKTIEFLKKYRIDVTFSVESLAVSIEKCDFVLVGAESVFENGGVIGTLSISIIAKALNKPFYVAAESYKFTRGFPMNQSYLTETGSDAEKAAVLRTLGFASGGTAEGEGCEWLSVFAPRLDYTPPQYVSLLLTDLGVMTANGVSEELIRLYY